MMALYWRDESGIVHLQGELGSEFMFCSLAFDASSVSGFAEDDMVLVPGPASCSECKKAVDAARLAMRGAKFSNKLSNLPELTKGE